MSKQHLEETAAAPLTPRQMAKLFGGVIARAVQVQDPRVVRVSWGYIHEKFLGGRAKVDSSVATTIEQMTPEQRKQMEEFVGYASALVGACLRWCRLDDVKAASAFYAEREEPWELLGKEVN